MTDEQIEHCIAQVDGSFAMEGMSLTEEDKKVLRRFAKGEITMEQVIASAREIYGHSNEK
ncbi:hypothetical protein Desaci_4801 (plasmid) [Desulfosporosinus acidiphilus SJ4]|uniref:Antitoxin VbhA domain-containing protein n=1 Tax=Desulfosporosinus acidiphilus (strain DSM 22704 / JCM 16185 / SJ4) TaxID=646529 RepID=I4DCV0_DESAJ|nr:antitoxin VbhA family protein [Desulfosporosinus acidiphilus]AFM43624.1 hypothetical protein Desaci_4801 [Desulfosporosinus acidiphilus SJ4]